MAWMMTLSIPIVAVVHHGQLCRGIATWCVGCACVRVHVCQDAARIRRGRPIPARRHATAALQQPANAVLPAGGGALNVLACRGGCAVMTHYDFFCHRRVGVFSLVSR